MGKVCLDILINSAKQNSDLAATTDYWKSYYVSKYGNRSIFSLVQDLPNWKLPRTMEPTNDCGDTAKELYISHTTAAIPCIVERIKPNATVEEIREEKKKMFALEGQAFEEQRKEVLRQQEYLNYIKKTYHDLVGKNPTPAVKALLNEIDRMFDPNKTFVRSAFAHNKVINLEDPNLIQITKDEIAKDIKLVNSGNITAWHQNSTMKEFLDQFNKLGMTSEFITDRIESGAVVQSLAEVQKVNSFWQKAADPRLLITNYDNISFVQHGDRTYNIYDRTDYLEYKQAIKFTNLQDSDTPIQVVNTDMELSSEASKTK